MRQAKQWQCAIVVLALCAAFPNRGLAWNFVAHELVARVAWDRLAPDTREHLRTLIRQHPALNADLLRGMPVDFGDRDLYAFLVAATWPDVIRAEHNPWHALHRPTWHYINLPLILPGTDRTQLKGAEPAPMNWQPGTEPDNIVQALEKCEKDLRDPNLPAPDKAVALSWYLHLVGDVHQPMHANTLFSDRFPAGDKGGNGSIVRSPVLTTQPTLVSPDEVAASIVADELLRTGGTPATRPAAASAPATLPAEGPINLHAYWDNLFGRFGAPRVLDALDVEITSEHPFTELKSAAADLRYADWANESNAIAAHDARRDGTLATASADEQKQPRHPPVPSLPPDYLPNAQAVGRLRIATAGYRLANELNDIFATK